MAISLIRPVKLTTLVPEELEYNIVLVVPFAHLHSRTVTVADRIETSKVTTCLLMGSVALNTV